MNTPDRLRKVPVDDHAYSIIMFADGKRIGEAMYGYTSQEYLDFKDMKPVELGAQLDVKDTKEYWLMQAGAVPQRFHMVTAVPKSVREYEDKLAHVLIVEVELTYAPVDVAILHGKNVPVHIGDMPPGYEPRLN